MASNYNSGDDALVYIRRGLAPGSWTYDYYLMTSLPTNDNPRYSVGNDNQKQDIITSFHFKFATGPSDIKIKTSPYPEVSGDKYDSTAIFSPDIAVEVKIYVDDKPVTYYAGFHTETGKIVHDFIPYRNEQLNYQDADVYPYYAKDFIQYTGVPEFRFKQMYYNKFKIPANSGEFNNLPDLASGIVSGVPAIIDQVGTFAVQSKNYPQERVNKDYKLTYNTTYEFIDMESQELIVSGFFNYPNTIPLDPSPNPNKYFNNYFNNDPKGNKVVFVTGIITNSTDGVITANPAVFPEEKRIEAGSQLYKIPLINFYGRDDMTNCKVTQIGYKVSNADKYTHKKKWFDDKDNPARKIWLWPNSATPSTYVFYSADDGAGYSRLPECWPWSCRRWTVENDGYSTEDISGNKVAVSLGGVPRFTIKMSSFSGDEKTYNPYILNQAPLTDSSPGSYFNGYFLGKIDVTENLNDAQVAQCGCDSDNTLKVELAAELFPVMHNATCKYVIKLGYLCYPTLSCTVPNVGTTFKKIIYPFNSCKFNETFEIDLDKLKYPDVTINNQTLTVSPTQKALLSYVFISGIRPVVTDPYTYEQPKPITGTTGIEGSTGSTGFIIYPPYTEKKTVSLDGGYTIDMTNKVGFLSVAARYPCKYTTDVHIYQVSPEGLEVKFIYPLNTIHDCPIQSLAKVTIQGNATDESESLNDIITGGDYYIKDNKRVFWNKCDLPRQTEVYKSSSLGNIENFITTQNGCCKWCQYTDKGKPAFTAHPQCIDLEKEATVVGVGWLDEGLADTDSGCSMKQRTPCKRDQIRGNALLISTATVYAQTPENVWMHGLGEMFVSGEFIKMYDSGVWMNAEASVSGDYIVRINSASDPLEGVADLIAAGIVITPG